MGDFKILFLCDRKACEDCHEECRHTSDIEHAEHRYDLHGRIFQFLEEGCSKPCFFEVE